MTPKKSASDEALEQIRETVSRMSRELATWIRLATERDAAKLAAIERAEEAETQVERMRGFVTQYPCTLLDPDELEDLIRMCLDPKYREHADPLSVPWDTLADLLKELLDYRQALHGEAR